MAEFIKSSTEVILHQPSGGDWDVYSQNASIYFINLVMHIKGVDGPKELKLKKYHTKAQGETYFLLSTSPDVDSNNATDDAAILTQDLAEDEYRVCAFAEKMQARDSITSEYSLIKPATSGYGGYRWTLHSRSADGRHTKVVFDAAKVPTLVSVKCGMWGQDQYGSSCTPFVIEVNGFTAQTSRFHTGNYVGEATLNVPLPLNMLVKRDDGLLYTLGGAGGGGGNFVTTDKEQLITGKKTFSKVPQVTAKPAAPNDVATVGYVSGLLNAKAPYDVTLDFKVEDDTDGGWVVYSNMEINLDNGKKLKCIHIDNTQPTSANAPVKAVFKAIPATEVINAAPAEQAPTFFDTYQLQDEEYLGTLTYGHILNSQLQDYASYKGPFHTNQYGTTCTIKEATQLRISISELPAAVSKVSLKFDSSYLPKTFKASLSGVGMDVTSNVLTNPSGNTPLELLFDVVKLTGLVTLDTAQTITGVKTFEKLPKSEAVPADDKDLVNKKYVDEKVGAGGGTGAAPANMVTTDTAQNITEVKTFDKLPKSSAIPNADDDLINRLYATQTFVPLGVTTKVDIHFGSYNGDNWIGWDKLQIRLRDNSRLDVKYIEDVFKNDDRRPIRVVFTTVKNFSDPVTVHELKSIDFLNSYKLEAGEYFGYLTYGYGISGNFLSSNRTDTPWTLMLFRMVNDKSNTVVRFEIEQLDKELKCIYFRIVDGYGDGRQLYADSCQITYATAFGSTAVPYNGPFTYGTEVTVDLPENDPNVMKGYVVTIRSLEARIKALEDAAAKP